MIAQKQAEKQKKLQPYEPGRVEKFLTNFELNLQKPSRVAINFGPMLPGAGMRLGIGYLTYVGDRALLTVRGAYSLKNYKSVAVQLLSPGHATDRVDLEFGAGWRDAPQTPYYGLGNDSLRSNRTNFLLAEAWAQGGVRVRPAAWRPFSVAADMQYSALDTSRGRGRTPSTETVFTDLTAPGLLTDPTYIRYTGEIAIDTRESPGYSRSGTLLRTAYSRYDDRDSARFDFNRLDVEATQYIPILRGNWVIALHGEMASTTTDDDRQVPFFMQPALGSTHTLRAYRTYRFRDLHSLLLSGEFRWTPNEALDMAIFYDAGKVARRRGDLDLEDLHTDFGVGARFHGVAFTGLRIELARGKEGMRLVFSTTPTW